MQNRCSLITLLLIHTATVPGQPGAVVRFSIGREKPGTWRAFAWHDPIHNLGGAPGAWLADTLFFIFGVMAYTIPVIIVGGCWFAWRHQSTDDYIDYFAVSLRLIGVLALILTSCGLEPYPV